MFSLAFDKLSETDSSKFLSPEITSATTLVKPDIALSFRALPVSLAKLLEAIFFTAHFFLVCYNHETFPSFLSIKAKICSFKLVLP